MLRHNAPAGAVIWWSVSTKCRLQQTTDCRLATKCKMQTTDWVQYADWDQYGSLVYKYLVYFECPLGRIRKLWTRWFDFDMTTVYKKRKQTVSHETTAVCVGPQEKRARKWDKDNKRSSFLEKWAKNSTNCPCRWTRKANCVTRGNLKIDSHHVLDKVTVLVLQKNITSWSFFFFFCSLLIFK